MIFKSCQKYMICTGRYYFDTPTSSTWGVKNNKFNFKNEFKGVLQTIPRSPDISLLLLLPLKVKLHY